MLSGDRAKTLAIMFLALALAGLSFKQTTEVTMRVKEFNEKIQDDTEFVWFTNNLFPRTLREGQRVIANANLLRLCRKAYDLGGSPLQADPEPKPEPVEVPDGGESTSNPSEGQEDSP